MKVYDDSKLKEVVSRRMAFFKWKPEAAFYEFALHEGITVNSLSVEVEGRLDLRGLFMVEDSVPAGFSDISYSFNINSPDEEEKVKALAEKVVAHCPVVDSLKRPLSLTGNINITREE